MDLVRDDDMVHKFQVFVGVTSCMLNSVAVLCIRLLLQGMIRLSSMTVAAMKHGEC